MRNTEDETQRLRFLIDEDSMSLPTSLLVNDRKSKITEVGKWGISCCFLCLVHEGVSILRYPLTKRTRLSSHALWCSPSAQSTVWAAAG